MWNLIKYSGLAVPEKKHVERWCIYAKERMAEFI